MAPEDALMRERIRILRGRILEALREFVKHAAPSVQLTQLERSTALKAARAMGLNVAGVDLLRSKRGPVVFISRWPRIRWCAGQSKGPSLSA